MYSAPGLAPLFLTIKGIQKDNALRHVQNAKFRFCPIGNIVATVIKNTII